MFFVALVVFGLLAWGLAAGLKRQAHLYTIGAKVVATVLKVDRIKGGWKMTISFPNKTNGFEVTCETTAIGDYYDYSNAVGRKVRVVPHPDKCDGVIGPMEPAFK